MPRNRKCAVTLAIEAMTPGDREIFHKVIASELSSGVIAKALRMEGYPVDRLAVAHYRRKLEAGKATLEFD